LRIVSGSGDSHRWLDNAHRKKKMPRRSKIGGDDHSAPLRAPARQSLKVYRHHAAIFGRLPIYRTGFGSTSACTAAMMCDVVEFCSADGHGSAERVRILVASDLHQRRSLYGFLNDAVIAHRPHALVLLGDFMHAFERENGMLSVADCAKAVAALDVPQVLLCVGTTRASSSWSSPTQFRLQIEP